MRRALHVLLVCLATLLAWTSFAPAAFAGPRTEAAAKDALKKAEDEYLRMDFAKALARLQKAEKACGEAGCNATTRAALFRDIGVMQFRLGQKDSATASFRRAKKLDPKIQQNPSYDAQDLRDAWNEQVAPESPAGGDFQHTPARAQAARTPLPIYVVPTTSEALASVAVKYKNDEMKGFRRISLKKTGEGWGGYVPCADVVEGNVRYFVQGFDKDGELVASVGDPQRTFTVPIRDSVDEPPSLPGQSPPRKCGEEQLETLSLVEGDRCQEDRQCKSGSCVDGVCKAAATSAEEDTTGPRDYARFWIGIAGSLDLTLTPGQSEVCAGGSSFHCTTPEGADYPGKDDAALVAGRSGTTASGVNPGGFHVVATLDYAATANLLVGARLGYVAGAYPGTQGKTLGTPLHAEARVTYLLGDQPLARPGIAAYFFGGAGVARFDASTTVLVGEKNVVGDRAVQAWLVAGPAFASAGGGARYAFSPRAAASTGLAISAAIGPGTFAFTAAPEIQFHYGF